MLQLFCSLLVSVLVVALALWSACALWFRMPLGARTRRLAVVLWCLLALTVLWGFWRGFSALALSGFALAFAAIVLWWLTVRPSNAHTWADELACMSSGEVHGNQVTLTNVRNFDWRSRSDYTVRWETRHYDLRALDSVDLITSYWAGPAIAHVLVSFGFHGGEQIVFSVEIRRQRGQPFSEIGGFFKAFNLSIIAADERDVIRLRTNIRGEDDYLYRVRLSAASRRALFCAYIDQANQLLQAPRFYNTVTVNCTTLVFRMMRHIVGHLPLDLRLLFSGYLPSYVYAVGGLDRRYTLAELRAFGRITERARQADRNPDFSAAIRAGIPPLAPPVA
jgi:Domain of unknown function (DUF4105)